MKKKIAGVLTTVLAASLLVGGNHPVTVQVDNMISGSQDDEDAQSDEAEAEAAEAEEEQAEEAKVAADPEDQPAATETPKEEKKAEKFVHAPLASFCLLTDDSWYLVTEPNDFAGNKEENIDELLNDLSQQIISLL